MCRDVGEVKGISLQRVVEIWRRIVQFVLRGLSGARSAMSRSWLTAKPRREPPTRTPLSAPAALPPEMATPAAPQRIPLRPESGELEPGHRIYAIGDIHGRADLLNNLIRLIEEDANGHEGRVTIVFLGDYIDRGFQSRQVIDTIIGERLKGFEVRCLKGNHEEAMLTFLADPDFGPRWAAYGGRETLVSYGIRPPRSMTRTEEWQAAHGEFVRALPREHENFLLELETAIRIGPYGFVHAGLRPGVPFEDQSEADLLWIREEFLKSQAAFDVVVVHGHTPVNAPFQDVRRINVDTGAYFSGRLTAVRLEGDEVSFLTTKT